MTDIELFNKMAYSQLNVPFNDFNKDICCAIIKIKEAIAQSIKNGITFCNTTSEISIKKTITFMELDEFDQLVKMTEDFTISPEYNDIQSWLNEFIRKLTEYKPLAPQAIENMKKKGITPKLQPSDILIFLIVPSKTGIHIAISVPLIYRDSFSIENFMKEVMSCKPYNITIDEHYGFVDYIHNSPIKERDVILQSIFNQLKKVGIYLDDTVDDEIIFSIE